MIKIQAHENDYSLRDLLTYANEITSGWSKTGTTLQIRYELRSGDVLLINYTQLADRIRQEILVC